MKKENLTQNPTSAIFLERGKFSLLVANSYHLIELMAPQAATEVTKAPKSKAPPARAPSWDARAGALPTSTADPRLGCPHEVTGL